MDSMIHDFGASVFSISIYLMAVDGSFQFKSGGLGERRFRIGASDVCGSEKSL